MSNGGAMGQGVALVLAGAVAKGAFGAGAVSRIAKERFNVRCVAATSSGALTAAVISAGVVTGQFELATDLAREIWLDHSEWKDIVHVSLADWRHARGLFDSSRTVAIVRDAIERVVRRSSPEAATSAFRLTLVGTSLNPVRSERGPGPSVHEKAFHFHARHFFDEAQRLRIAMAAAASAAFPIVFAPTVIDANPYVDGGVVNNAPISYVLDDAQVTKILAVTSEAAESRLETTPGGVDLISTIVDIGIHERIAHDVTVATKTNERLRRVRSALDANGASEEAKKAVEKALGWRLLDVALIHPSTPLPGTSFSGLRNREQRQQYIDAGYQAADAILGGRS